MAKIIMMFLVCALLVSFSTSAVMIRGKISGFDRLKEPEIDQCLKSKICIVTMDLTHTCGSDGRTYPNRGTIDCLNECLKPEEKVTVVSGCFCKDDAPLVDLVELELLNSTEENR